MFGDLLKSDDHLIIENYGGGMGIASAIEYEKGLHVTLELQILMIMDH